MHNAVAYDRSAPDTFNPRERDLVQENDRLKALMFGLRQEQLASNAPASAAAPSPAVPFRRQQQRLSSAAAAEKGSADAEAEAAGEAKTVTVLKSEYDALVVEVASQELLIQGFQRENEKLVHCLQAKEQGETSQRAGFFDQQEALNKELNRLRNLVGGGEVDSHGKPSLVSSSLSASSAGGAMAGASSIRKSADALRAELNADATIRALKERVAVAEAGAGAREKEMQLTIDKLRRDNRALAASSAQVSEGIFSGQNSEKQALDQQQKKHLDEVGDLRGKLAWYVENQVLIEDAMKQKADASAVAAVLKKELRRRGMDNKAIAVLLSATSNTVSGYGRPIDQDLDNSMASATTANNTNRSHIGGGSSRNPADIKKIKDLEASLAELQECLYRRNPDSVSSLIRYF